MREKYGGTFHFVWDIVFLRYVINSLDSTSSGAGAPVPVLYVPHPFRPPFLLSP